MLSIHRVRIVTAFLACGLAAQGCLTQDYASLNSSTSALTSGTLSLSASSSAVAPGGSLALYATGGVPPYNYVLASGTGTVNGTTYTAGSSAGVATVEVYDSANNTALYTITVEVGASGSGGLTVSLSSPSVITSGTLTVSISNGTAPYQYQVISGGGAFYASNSNTATYLAPSVVSVVEIQVTDANGLTGTASISVQETVSLNAASTMPVYSDIYIVFDMPNNTALKPSFAFGEASSNGLFGYAVDCTSNCSTTSFDSNGSTGIALNNFDSTSTYPYTGTLTVSLQSNTGTPVVSTFSFCVTPGSSSAVLSAAGSGSQVAAVQQFSLISFPALPSGASVSGGAALQEARLENFSANSLQTASVEITGGNHAPSLASCSGFTGLTLLSDTSN